MRARDVAVKGDLNALSKALMMYYADYGKFPTTIGSGGEDGDWGTQFDDGGATPYVYMKVLPHTRTDVPYCYVVNANLDKFGLFAMLENKSDSECHMASATDGEFDKCGYDYCYYIISPNAVVTDL
jgi:hypothetical protein